MTGGPHVLLLAAGRGRRGGGTHKLLWDWRGRPLVVHAAEAALAAGLPVTAVVGHNAAAVAAALAHLPVAVADAPDWAEGMAASLRRGLAALPAEAGAAVVALGDMPRVPAAIHAALAAAWRAGHPLCRPVWRGRPGHPVLFDRSLLPDLLALRGDGGARAVLERHAARLHAVPAPDDGVLADIDTPEALAALRGPAAGDHPSG
ncbi:MAG TPA: NTP transferase domain-containing protein [Alphaproteobacteria bacterium]|nr:NTP transferase domain-containing protein [Alphaproteobacteria bacterium]